jgi:hypothetical protein
MTKAISSEASPGKPPTDADIDDAISRWHEGHGAGRELHDYLGWSWAEYQAWVADPSAIPERQLRRT